MHFARDVGNLLAWCLLFGLEVNCVENGIESIRGGRGGGFLCSLMGLIWVVMDLNLGFVVWLETWNWKVFCGVWRDVISGCCCVGFGPVYGCCFMLGNPCWV